MVAVVGAGAVLGSSGDSDDASPDPVGFCRELERLSENDPFAAFGDRATPAQIDAAFDALVERAAELVELAPAESRGAALDLSENAQRLRELLAAAEGDPAEVDALAYRDAQGRYTAAGDRLERYLTTEC